VLLNQPFRSAPNHLVKVELNLQEHPDGNPVFVHRLQNFEQVIMPLSFGHIYRAFTASVLKRPRRSHFDQPLQYFDLRTSVGGLMQRCIERFRTRTGGIDELTILGHETQAHETSCKLWPVCESRAGVRRPLIQGFGPV
jgi:hypothetical protein